MPLMSRPQNTLPPVFKLFKCADCNASDPTWASINRGVLVCWECCQIHRALGRHISDIMSLNHSNWAPTRLQMLQNLVQNDVNNIWEHELHSSSKSNNPPKPSTSDRLRPNKENFIIAKYRDGRYCQRLDDNVNSESLNSQLLIAASQSSLETSLRLLVMGAYVNCCDNENNTPLHIAAKHNQILQYELLTIYGGNPNTINNENLTPYSVARKHQHHITANRILALQYELTDRLIYFITQKQPDHLNGQHIIVPIVERGGPAVTEAKNKLRILDNQSFEDLATDLYDEVDRREAEHIWMSVRNMDGLDVRFLPTNPVFSPRRNQGRQKLGRLNEKDFIVLISHVLEEGKHREQLSRPITHYSHGSNEDEPSYCDIPSEYSDPEPLYDEGHSSPVYDQVPERDEYIDNKQMITAKYEAQQNMIKFLLDEKEKLKHRMEQLESRNRQLEYENTQLRSQLQSFQNRHTKNFNDYDVAHVSSGSSGSDLNSGRISVSSRKHNSVMSGRSRDMSLPSLEVLTAKTKLLTTAVTCLRDAIRKKNPAEFPDIYHKILLAAQAVTSVFPENPSWQTVKLGLDLLNRSAVEMSRLQISQFAAHEDFINAHVDLAKDIARAAKSLMSYCESK